MREKAYLGVCLGYDAERGEALIEQRNRMVVGDRVEFLTPGHIAEPLVYEALYDEEHNEIDASRHPYMRFYIKTSTPLSAGDIIRAVIE
jgi:putative protease